MILTMNRQLDAVQEMPTFEIGSLDVVYLGEYARPENLDTWASASRHATTIASARALEHATLADPDPQLDEIELGGFGI
jgi:hypothetical protein